MSTTPPLHDDDKTAGAGMDLDAAREAFAREFPVFANANLVRDASVFQKSARELKSALMVEAPFDNAAFPVMPRALNNTAMWQEFMFDRDAAYAMSQETDAHIKSVAADVYAVLRHLSRHGGKTGFPAFIRDLRNINLVHKGDVEGWSTRAIDRVLLLLQSGKIGKMTPHAAFTLAGKIAAVTALDIATRARVTFEIKAAVKVTADCRKTNINDGDRAMMYVAAVTSIGAQTGSKTVHEICLRYMNRYQAFIPQDLAIDKTLHDFKQMGGDLKTLRDRKPPDTDPPLAGYKPGGDKPSGHKPAGPKPPGS